MIGTSPLTSMTPQNVCFSCTLRNWLFICLTCHVIFFSAHDVSTHPFEILADSFCYNNHVKNISSTGNQGQILSICSQSNCQIAFQHLSYKHINYPVQVLYINVFNWKHFSFNVLNWYFNRYLTNTTRYVYW